MCFNHSRSSLVDTISKIIFKEVIQNAKGNDDSSFVADSITISQELTQCSTIALYLLTFKPSLRAIKKIDLGQVFAKIHWWGKKNIAFFS